jgi:hypothetical protein
MRRRCSVAWILGTLLQIRTPNESIARTAWTMGGATETRAECEVTMVETVRHEQEWATTRAKELQSKKALGDMTVQNHPNGVFLITKGTRTEKRVGCWPAGADPRGLTR